MTNEELVLQAQQGDKNAEFQLWEQVQRLIRKKAYRRLPDDGHTARFELDDLMQAGYIAMMNAIKDFNHLILSWSRLKSLNHSKPTLSRSITLTVIRCGRLQSMKG